MSGAGRVALPEENRNLAKAAQRGEPEMIGYVTIGTTDMEKSKAQARKVRARRVRT